MNDLQLSDLLPDGWLGVYKDDLGRFSCVSPGAKTDLFCHDYATGDVESLDDATAVAMAERLQTGEIFVEEVEACKGERRRHHGLCLQRWWAPPVCWLGRWAAWNRLRFMLGSAELDVELSQLERLEVAFGLERPRRLEHRCRESMLILPPSSQTFSTLQYHRSVSGYHATHTSLFMQRSMSSSTSAIATKLTLPLTATSSSPGLMKRCANCSHFLPRIHNIAGILCFMHVARHLTHNSPHTCPAVH